MQKIGELLTFEQYRLAHEEALRRQRETLENGEIANEVLTQGGGTMGWRQWDDNVLALQG